MADKVHEPKTAITKLLYDYGSSGYDVVQRGYFPSFSSVYNVANKDINAMNVKTIMNLSKSLHLEPGFTLNELIELQKEYPPRKPMKK